MKGFTIKLLGTATGLLFAGAGSAAAYPGLVQAASAAHVSAGPTGSALAAGAHAQASADADLSSASTALGRAQAITQSGVAGSANQALHLYSTAAGELADAAEQAQTMAQNGMQTGASTLEQVAATINGEVTSLTVSTAAGFSATMSAVPDVTTALKTTAAAAQAQAGATRTQVMDQVGRASSDLQNLVSFTPAPAGPGSAGGSASAGMGGGAGSASASGSGSTAASNSGGFAVQGGGSVSAHL